MPSSYVDSFPPIVHTLINMRPRNVVDIGPGWGKYGLALREYVPDIERLYAIEVAEGRLPVQDVIYDMVYTGDVRYWPSREFWVRFDLVMLIDVIEHMPYEDGQRLLERIIRAGARVLVATPKTWFEQSDPTNPHEKHISFWGWEDLSGVRGSEVIVDASTIDAIIYVLGPK